MESKAVIFSWLIYIALNSPVLVVGECRQPITSLNPHRPSKVGGVWRKNYADFGLQVPKELFEFPDFPYPETFKCDDFPTGEEVQEYILLYCNLGSRTW